MTGLWLLALTAQAQDLEDRDADGIANELDVCPNDPDPDQLDGDGDGHGDACDACPLPADPLDSDGDSVCDGVDVCPGSDDRDDHDGDTFPDACDDCPEDAYGDSDGDGRCDSDDLCPSHHDAGPDTDVDGYVDGCDNCLDVANDQRDYDADGFGDLCDCGIGRPERHPGADETCNGEDDDCDGTTDEDPIDGETWWQDADGDGQGDADNPWSSCGEGAGLVANADDCDDFHELAFVGGLEVCDDLDNDCDGEVDGMPQCAEGDDVVQDGCGCDGTGGLPIFAGLLAPLLLRRRRS